MSEILLKDDMGSDNILKILQEDDGDIIISIISEDDKFSHGKEVQFCTSGTANHGLASFFRKLIALKTGATQ